MRRRRTVPAALVGAALSALALAGCSGRSSSSGGPSGSTASDGDSLSTASTPIGTVIVDGKGMTVYYFAKDTRGETASMCTGACATFWPPVLASAIPMLSGISAIAGTIAAPGGGRQVTIDGLPIYTYAGDSNRGDTNGEESSAYGGRWWAVAPNGAKVTSMGSGVSPSP